MLFARFNRRDVAGVIALPPLIFLAFLVAATVLEALVPLPLLAGHALARYLAGAALVVCGLVLIAMGTSRFVDGIYGTIGRNCQAGAPL